MSEWFDESYYLVDKAAQVNSLFKTNTWNALNVKEAIINAGFTSIEEHYKLCGAFETSVNANRSFDDERYYNDKAAQLNSLDPQHAEWTGQKVSDAFKAYAINPIEHYLRFGKSEGLKATSVSGEQYNGWQNLSGDSIIDAVIGDVPSWNGSNLNGANLLSYNFLTSPPDSGDTYNDFSPMNSEQQANTAIALGKITNITGINFAKSSTSEADIHFALADMPQGVGGMCYNSWSYFEQGGKTEYAQEALVYIDNDAYHSLSQSKDTAWFETLLHEIGHAMGLKHPFEPPVTLPKNLDSDKYTLMSYTETGNFSDYQSIDILGLQYLYGQDGLEGSQGLGSSMG